MVIVNVGEKPTRQAWSGLDGHGQVGQTALRSHSLIRSSRRRSHRRWCAHVTLPGQPLLYMLGVSSPLWSTPKGGSGEVVKHRSTDECHCIETMGDLINQEDVEGLIS